MLVLGTTVNPGERPSYMCEGISCWGTTAAATTKIRTMQELLNKFRGVAGFSAIAVDGTIGRETVNASNKTHTWIDRQERGAGAGVTDNSILTVAKNTVEQSEIDILEEAVAKYQPKPPPPGADTPSSDTSWLAVTGRYPLLWAVPVLGVVGFVWLGLRSRRG